MESVQLFGRAQKINLVDLKKKSTNFLKFFENLRFLEKIVEPPLHKGGGNCLAQIIEKRYSKLHQTSRLNSIWSLL